MVKKVTPNGNVYHMPPYTKAEELEFYRRVSGIVGVMRPVEARNPAAAATTAKPAARPK